MQKRRAAGITIFAFCIVGFFVYSYLVMLSEWSPVVMQLSLLMIVGGLLGVIAWLGYVMATTKSSASSLILDDSSGQ